MEADEERHVLLASLSFGDVFRYADGGTQPEFVFLWQETRDDLRHRQTVIESHVMSFDHFERGPLKMVDADDRIVLLVCSPSLEKRT